VRVAITSSIASARMSEDDDDVDSNLMMAQAMYGLPSVAGVLSSPVYGQGSFKFNQATNMLSPESAEQMEPPSSVKVKSTSLCCLRYLCMDFRFFVLVFDFFLNLIVYLFSLHVRVCLCE
jgi:hypothetical protein